MKPEFQTNGNNIGGSMNVLVVYDSVCSGKRAKELCDRLGKLSRKYKLNLSFWNMSVLQVAPLAQAAATAAAHAALVIVSVNADTVLPPLLKNWIGRYVRETRALGGALVAQLHGVLRKNKELSPIHVCLKQIAQDAGVSFFSGVTGTSAKQQDYSMEGIQQRAQIQGSVLKSILRRYSTFRLRLHQSRGVA